MKKYIAAGAAVAAFVAVIPSAAMADTINTDFEAPVFSPGSVDSQDGWHSAVIR
jgi:hypothetical protein